MHHDKDIECRHKDAACTEAELLPKVGHLIDEPEGTALTASFYASKPQQSAEHSRMQHDGFDWAWTALHV